MRWSGHHACDQRDADDVHPDSPDPRGYWHRAGTVRRLVLLGLVLAQTYLATSLMVGVLPYHGEQPLEIAILALFAILFCWVSANFWTATAGFLLLLFGDRRYAISRNATSDAPWDPQARTAVVMPICNESVPRVFAGLGATYESLSRTGNLQHFDFFVLSDSTDPDLRVAEVKAWFDLCRTVKGFGRVFYRLRQHRIKRKSGNIADFCRRWGSRYRYMVVLDADSVMSGECLTRLVRLMETHPNAGIIQTVPRAAGRDTLFARLQQFAARVYGPMVAAGLHFWQLGEAYYWGHNAILRVAPFIRHCALGRLPGRGVFSGEILSHDFVEAALMRRAGWAVWIAYDLSGSYEEMPPNLVDELKRDRRWCHGNLINFRLLLAKGLHPAHRAVFATGVMVYVSALLWFAFLMLSTTALAAQTLLAPQYFFTPKQLFPLWPEWRPALAIGLVCATATLLFLPKLLSLLLILKDNVRHFGGGICLVLSVLAESVLSMLLAPIRMLWHTTFVVGALMGWSARWQSPARDNSETTWGEGFRRHAAGTLLGLVWAGGVYWLSPAFLWWLLPVVGALILSIPLSVYSSRTSLGRRLRKARLFLIPEEIRPPKELEWTRQYLNRAMTPPGFMEAVVDPVVNALVCASGRIRTKPSVAVRSEHERIARIALHDGPDTLTPQQRTTLLGDPLALTRLHFQVWTSPEAHPRWLAGQTSGGNANRDVQGHARVSAAHLPRCRFH